MLSAGQVPAAAIARPRIDSYQCPATNILLMHGPEFKGKPRPSPSEPSPVAQVSNKHRVDFDVLDVPPIACAICPPIDRQSRTDS
ncbi:hypothetical protein MTO96_039199 [Rhipicephalus appendiculatus]